MNYAFVTVLSTNDYYKYVIALFESIKETNTKINNFVVIVNEDINDNVINLLEEKKYRVIKKNKLTFSFVENETYKSCCNYFDKLYVFDLVEYDKVVYLDNDTYVLKNIDELFNYPHMSSVIDDNGYVLPWKENGPGLMVINPSCNTSLELIENLKNTKYNKSISKEYIIESYCNWRKQKLSISENYNMLVDCVDYYINELNYSRDTIAVVNFNVKEKNWMFDKKNRNIYIEKLIKENKVNELYYFNKYVELLDSIRDINKIKLSIITPFYNTLKYTLRLADVLISQLNDEVEWIIVDDGTMEYELDNLKARVIHLSENSGNASRPRNIGIDNSRGEYITFIDSDDLVTDNYVKSILEKIEKEDFDYCYFGWKCGESNYLIDDEPLDWNHSVWNCIYKKEIIGNERFDERYNIDEDGNFNERVRKGKKANLLDILYIYSWQERSDSISSLYSQGKIGFIKND